MRLAGVPLFLWLMLGPEADGWAVAVLAIGALYEIFEWLLTIGMNAEAADQYNGQQGDMFDAPKDMAMALLGSLVPLMWRRRLLSVPQQPDRSRPAPSAS